MARHGSVATSKESRSQGQLHDHEKLELDENYDLISILYHSLQGAETSERYIRDAENAEDEELVEFLTETRDEQIRRAARARQMLLDRLEEARVDQEEEEEEEEEDDEEEGEDEEDDEIDD